MSGMQAVETLPQPAPFCGGEMRQGPLEIGLVLVAPMLGLEQQDGGRPEIGDALGRRCHHLRAGMPDGRAAPADPDVGLTRLDHQIDPPAGGAGIEAPDLENMGRRLCEIGRAHV